MRSLVKFLLFALLIVFVGLWIMRVSQGCNQPDTTKTENADRDNTATEVTEVTDDLEDLFEEDTGDEDLFNDEGEDIATSGIDEDEFMEEEDLPEEEPLAVDNEPEPSSAHSGNMSYLVIGGAYLSESNANREVRRLQKLGYDEAEVVTFDFSQYYSVCVERFDNLREARTIKNQLQRQGNSEAYVHKKRSKKRR